MLQSIHCFSGGQAKICPFSLLLITITGTKLGLKGAALFLGVCLRFN